jgi:hypothetical protein
MYYHTTPQGTFAILRRSEMWHVLFEREILGMFKSFEEAIDALVSGRTFAPVAGPDPRTLDLPRDGSLWRRGYPD